MRLALSAVLLLAVSLPSVAAEPLQVSAVQVRLFYNHTGRLSKPLDGKESLFNTIIGEGSVEEPSTSTLVDVIVSGKTGTFDPAWRVDLTVTAERAKGKKAVMNYSSGVGVLSASGQYHAAFWLPETGCQALEITARIRGASSAKSTRVPFVCGE